MFLFQSKSKSKLQECKTTELFGKIFAWQKTFQTLLTFAERLSPRPGPVGEAYPLCRAVQRVSHRAGEANFAAYFEGPRLSTSVSGCPGITTGIRRVACKTRWPEQRQREQRVNRCPSNWTGMHVCLCVCVHQRWAHLRRRDIDLSHNVPFRGTVRSGLGLKLHIFSALEQPAVKHTMHQWAAVTMPTTWRKKTFHCHWHLELSVHKTGECSIKNRSAVPMKNEEHSVFIPLNYLFAVLLCASHHLSCTSVKQLRTVSQLIIPCAHRGCFDGQKK